MPEFSSLAAFIAASAILGITPGPDILYVIMRGAAQGARAGLAAAAGLTTGIIGHTTFCVIGVSAIIASSAVAFTVLKIAGAAYLIYLGVRMLRAGKGLELKGGGGAQPLWSIYRQTVVMNLINPKVALFFLAFLPQFVTPGSGPVPLQLAVLGVTFMVVSFVVMASAGLAGGQIRRWLARSDNAARRVQYTAGAVLIALGARLAFEGRG